MKTQSGNRLQIYPLHQRGFSPEQIAEKLGVSMRLIKQYIVVRKRFKNFKESIGKK